MAEAFERAGVERDETPQEAAERIWMGTERPPNRQSGSGGRPGHDPVETMRRFDEWARKSPDRMLAVITKVIWLRAVRAFLERHPEHGGWRLSPAFKKAMYRTEKKVVEDRSNAKSKRDKRWQWDRATDIQSLTYVAKVSRRGRDRVKRGVKIVRAEVDIKTGAVVNLIDKEYGPFAHIRINGLPLAQVTTELALRHCDNATTDVRFIRALCQQIPDPRKPIGEQWTADMIRKARNIAERTAA